MRLFTAIDLPAEIAGRLDTLIGKLRPLAPIGWSRTANLHITAKFIGQWPEDRLAQLNRSLAGLASRPPMEIRVRSLGFYPNQKSPRVFWAGVEESPALTSLAEDTDAALEKLGIQRETRTYSPHLTLARIKESSGLSSFLKEVGRLKDPDFGAFPADRFYLYLSKPGPGGSVYTKLSEFPFTS